jgi:transposase
MCRTALGWDLHRRFSKVSLVEQPNPQTPEVVRVVRRARLEHDDRDGLRAWLAELPAGTPVALEGAFGWPWVADLLSELGLDPHLGHPPGLRALAAGEAKSDRADADRLARFWLKGTFPRSYLATPEVRQIRERVRFRMALAGIRTQVKNRLHAILHRQGLQHNFSDLFGKRGRAWLAGLTLPPGTRYAFDHWLALLDHVVAQLTDVEAWMEANLKADPVVAILQTIPGIGLILAHVIRAEVGELEPRFASRQKFTRYVGLAPMADDSADRRGRRHLSPICNHALRWAFIEAAAATVHSNACPRKLRRLHDRLIRRGGAQQARVAVARELAELVYTLWKKGEPYREIPSPGRPRVAN